MSWHFSKALVDAYENSRSSRELAAGSSGANSSDGELFAPLRSSDLPDTYSWHDKTTEPLNLSQYGMMSELSTADLGEELLTWFREDFLIRTSPSSDHASASLEPGQDCGVRWHGLLKRWLPGECSSRTLSNYDGPDSALCSEILPFEGMMQDGRVFQRRRLELIIVEPDCGWWPTPLASDVKRGVEKLSALKKRDRKKGNDFCTFAGVTGTQLHPNLREALMGFPINWTAIRSSAMPRYLEWLQRHGKSSTANPSGSEPDA